MLKAGKVHHVLKTKEFQYVRDVVSKGVGGWIWF